MLRFRVRLSPFEIMTNVSLISWKRKVIINHLKTKIIKCIFYSLPACNGLYALEKCAKFIITRRSHRLYCENINSLTHFEMPSAKFYYSWKSLNKKEMVSWFHSFKSRTITVNLSNRTLLFFRNFLCNFLKTVHHFFFSITQSMVLYSVSKKSTLAVRVFACSVHAATAAQRRRSLCFIVLSTPLYRFHRYRVHARLAHFSMTIFIQ